LYVASAVHICLEDFEPSRSEARNDKCVDVTVFACTLDSAPEVRRKGPIVEELEGNEEPLPERDDFFVQDIVPVT
jgi:hypothetical protein